MKSVVRIGAGQGFWGDSLDAPRQLVEGGPLDYLMLDYLAEVTMSILQKQRARDPSLGYARDFVAVIDGIVDAIAERGLKVLSNAGGLNPRACAEAVRSLCRARGHGSIRIGMVAGDDLMPRLDALLEQGHPLANMDTGESLTRIRADIVAANAYLGAQPIAEALSLGAQIIVAGRTTDAALVLGPLRHEFGWREPQWDLLAAGVVAGHIVECGAQCSGGNCLYEWQTIPDLANIGYPIVEAQRDGVATITKHPGTGGRVSAQTVTEQLVYEIGDPAQYVTPDAVADFTSLRVEDLGKDRVRVSGVRGRAAPSTLKVSIAYRAGYKAVGTLLYTWPDAIDKARAADAILRTRLERLGLRFDRITTEFVGVSAAHGPLTPPPAGPLSEVQLRVGVRSGDRASVERFTREVAPLVLNGPPSVTGFAGGRPKVEEVIAYWPALIERAAVTPVVEMLP